MRRNTFLKLILCCLITAFSTMSFASAYQQVTVFVNNNRLDVESILYNDLTYVPLRAVCEAMGAEVNWNSASNSAFVAFSEDEAIAQLVADVSPAVVTIVGNYSREGEVYKYNNPTMHGSGVVYKSNGYIVTNAHVVKDIKNLTVVFSDGTYVPGNVLYSDEKSDLAVVKVNRIGLNAIKFAEKSTVMSGKTAIAVGTPISLSMRNSVTKGIVSGCDVTVSGSYYKVIQTDASINPGNSGGPLLNTKGELIGINSSKFASYNIDNVGFAIPVDTVEYVLKQYETYGYVLRPKSVIEFEESWEAKIGLPTQKGITVTASSVPELVNGDIVTAVGGIAVHSITDWNEAIKKCYNGDFVKVDYTRGGQNGTAMIQ